MLDEGPTKWAACYIHDDGRLTYATREGGVAWTYFLDECWEMGASLAIDAECFAKNAAYMREQIEGERADVPARRAGRGR